MNKETFEALCDLKASARPDQVDALMKIQAHIERRWVDHPQTIEAKAQWNAVARALGADVDCPDSVLKAARAAAQPSPGGQDALVKIIAALEHSKPTLAHYPESVQRHADALALARALAARQPVYVQGSDELRARTEGERAAYMEGLEEGKKIAARQPVGKPVAWFYGFSDTGEAGPVTFGGNPGAEAIAWAERHGHTLHYLYAAPPAQAVDLGRFREAVEGLKDAALHDRDPGPAVNAYNRVLALIDSKAAEK